MTEDLHSFRGKINHAKQKKRLFRDPILNSLFYRGLLVGALTLAKSSFCFKTEPHNEYSTKNTGNNPDCTAFANKDPNTTYTKNR